MRCRSIHKLTRKHYTRLSTFPSCISNETTVEKGAIAHRSMYASTCIHINLDSIVWFSRSRLSRFEFVSAKLAEKNMSVCLDWWGMPQTTIHLMRIECSEKNFSKLSIPCDSVESILNMEKRFCAFITTLLAALILRDIKLARKILLPQF